MAAERLSPLRVQRRTLRNGVKIVRQAPPPSAHSAAFTFLVPGGWGVDPPRLSGLAVFAATLLPSGAGRLNRIGLARTLDRLGATLSTDVAADCAGVTLTGPASVGGQLLRLLAEVVQRPRFTDVDMRRVRSQLIEEQLRELSQPDGRAERAVLEALFPVGHPYRSSEGLGSRSTIGRIRPEDVRRFHQRTYATSAGHLVGTTSWALDEFARRSAKLFGQLGPRESFHEVAPPSGKTPVSQTERISMPGRSQTEIRIGARSIARSDPEYPAAYLANQVLGGRGLLSRLFRLVRERAGLAYHAASSLEAMRGGGYFLAQAGTNPGSADRALDLMLAEVARLSTEKVPLGELDRVRRSAIGALRLAIETTSSAHSLAIDVEMYDLPDDHYERWPEVLRGVQSNDLRDAAARAFNPSQAVSVLAGPLPSDRGDGHHSVARS